MEASYRQIQWMYFDLLSLLSGIIVLKHSDMFVSVIAFPKVSMLFVTYNNNITVLLQLLHHYYTHTNIYKYDYSNCCHETDVNVV